MIKPLILVSVVMLSASGFSQTVRVVGKRLEVNEASGSIVLQAVADDVLKIECHPKGVSAVPTEMIDKDGLRRARPVGLADENEIVTSMMHVTLSRDGLVVTNSKGEAIATIDPSVLIKGIVRVRHPHGQNLYGMRGNGLFGPRDPRMAVSKGLLRNDGAPVAAGSQGDGGAPIAYTTRWGLLIDSIDGQFSTAGDSLEFSHGSRKDVEAYFVLGPPKRTIQIITLLTGRPAIPPKWALGFMNSQWGTDEKMVSSIISQYRQKQIPLDAFIFDFDFKAWGEDDFGEWRWNSTSGPGNVGPMKYPNGQNGKFAKEMAGQGVHLVGIMKPRVLTQSVDLKPTKAAAEADAHSWWMPGKKPYPDYFSHRLANDFDFSKPDLRKWYWQHSRNLFDSGISGWWNDEADDGFDSLGFFHMQQSLFEGQQSVSNRRVWSLNRNFYLGAQRFAFGTWSGDIRTGFLVMAAQEARMLALVNLGQAHWSMDSGGFNGHPTPENYARWLEFAAMTPIMRVHGTFGERRQPWVYGPVAEAAAKNAIRWRYAMFPSLYSWERQANLTGIGMVHPLFWEFPEDAQCANTVDSWMLGESLLVSPVVVQSQTTKKVYLPLGKWFAYDSDKAFAGGQTVELSSDPILWTDMPMFVRDGSILATQPVRQYADEHPVDAITLDVWPAASRRARFEVYDDDGETRNYEHGAYFSQNVTAWTQGHGAVVEFDSPDGSFRSPIHRYRLRIHGGRSQDVFWNGFATSSSQDKGITEVEVPAGQTGRLTLSYIAS